MGPDSQVLYYGGGWGFSVIMLEKMFLPGYCCRMLPGDLGTVDWLAVHPPARLFPVWTLQLAAWLTSLSGLPL